MCNRVHYDQDYQPIPQRGTGYKLMYYFPRVLEYGKYEYNYDEEYDPILSVVGGSNYEPDPRGTWVTWDKGFDGDGFCFFMNLEDAIRVGRLVHKSEQDVLVLCKIAYRQGLGEFDEKGFTGYYERIAIAKEFTIITKVCTFHLKDHIQNDFDTYPARDDWYGWTFLEGPAR